MAMVWILTIYFYCVLVHSHPSSPAAGAYSYFPKSEMGYFMCVQCDVCTDTGPPVLSPIQEAQVMYSKSLTHGDCSRICAEKVFFLDKIKVYFSPLLLLIFNINFISKNLTCFPSRTKSMLFS